MFAMPGITPSPYVAYLDIYIQMILSCARGASREISMR